MGTTDPVAVGVDPAKLADLVERVGRDVGERALPSCQVAVARHGRLVLHHTEGATPGTRYVAFSTTKMLIAGAIWLLIGDGALRPSDRVADHIDEFGTNGKDVVTVEQVLLMEGGFPHAPLGPPDWASRARRLERFARWRLNWEPGSRVEYHPTSAHWVLAELIERCSGTDYRQFVADRLLTPLRLDDLRLGDAPGSPAHHPVGHGADIADLQPVGTAPSAEEVEALTGIAGLDLGDLTDTAALLRFNQPEVRALGVPGAGAVGTAGDFALYLQAMLHNPHQLWDPAVLEDGTGKVRTTKVDALLGVPANRTLGLIVGGDDGMALRRGMASTTSPATFGHHGVGGQTAWADPVTGLSFCYLTNGLEQNPLVEGRRRAAVGNRAGACLLDT